jgi:hypothetical protein
MGTQAGHLAGLRPDDANIRQKFGNVAGPSGPPEFDDIPRNLCSLAVGLQVAPVDARLAAVGAAQKPAVRQTHHYEEFGAARPTARGVRNRDESACDRRAAKGTRGVRPWRSPS